MWINVAATFQAGQLTFRDTELDNKQLVHGKTWIQTWGFLSTDSTANYYVILLWHKLATHTPKSFPFYTVLALIDFNYALVCNHQRRYLQRFFLTGKDIWCKKEICIIISAIKKSAQTKCIEETTPYVKMFDNENKK